MIWLICLHNNHFVLDSACFSNCLCILMVMRENRTHTHFIFVCCAKHAAKHLTYLTTFYQSISGQFNRKENGNIHSKTEIVQPSTRQRYQWWKNSDEGGGGEKYLVVQLWYLHRIGNRRLELLQTLKSCKKQKAISIELFASRSIVCAKWLLKFNIKCEWNIEWAGIFVMARKIKWEQEWERVNEHVRNVWIKHIF